MSLILIRRMILKTGMKLACGALGIGSIALVLAVSVGVDANHPAESCQAAPENLPTDRPQEAPTGFDNLTNGFEDQVAFTNDRTGKFEEVETIADGLGPVYNATSCVSCHQNPVSGSSSQIAELRAGHDEPDPNDPKRVIFIEPPGGSLIHQRAIDAAIQEHVPPGNEVRTLRMSTNILGNGFVEVIPDEDILKIRAAQPQGMKGLPVAVPVAVAAKRGAGGAIEFEFVERIGRFGWKCQEASLLNFAAGAYLNEMGITNPLQPKENTSNGRDVTPFDHVPDPEDQTVDPNDPSKVEHLFGVDVEAFTRFMRSTKAPPRDRSLIGMNDAQEGEKIFRNLGCAICHHPDYTTPKAGTPIKPLHPVSMPRPGSDLVTVPEPLGNKIIHPYSDFMLHDVGTGDGIAQTQHAQRPPRGAERLLKVPDDIAAREGIVRVQADVHTGDKRILCDVPGLDQRTVNRIRTAPLWGLRVRPQLLHDGSALTIEEAIRKHQGQAQEVTKKYLKIVEEHPDQARQLLVFLNSL